MSILSIYKNIDSILFGVCRRARYALVVLFGVYLSNHIDRGILNILIEPIKAEFGGADLRHDPGGREGARSLAGDPHEPRRRLRWHHLHAEPRVASSFAPGEPPQRGIRIDGPSWCVPGHCGRAREPNNLGVA
jgi:hypothetical protein